MLSVRKEEPRRRCAKNRKISRTPTGLLLMEVRSPACSEVGLSRRAKALFMSLGNGGQQSGDSILNSILPSMERLL